MEKRLPTRAGSRKKVETQKSYRYVTPAVTLERKQISMLNPPPGPSQTPAPDSHTVSASDVSARTTIVGKKGPLEEEGSSLVLRAPPNGQSPKHATEEPTPVPSETRVPPAQEPTPKPKGKSQPEGQKEEEETKEKKPETRTQELSQGTKEETQVTPQELTKGNQALSSRTATQEPGARTTSTTEREPTTPDDGSRSPATSKTTSAAAGRPYVQFAEPPIRLETAELLEFFEEQAPLRKESEIQIAEQSVRPETTIVMEFFEGQPVRQESVQVPRQTARQDTTEVIEFFEEQDHSLEEVPRSNLLTVPSPRHGSLQRGQRSPSPGSLHPSIGLNHLDNLIRLMEQLSSLKDENAKLRKKCDYLETTKNLLKARSELMSTSDSSSASGYQSLPPARHKGHHHRHHHRNGSGTRDAEGGRPRLFSAEDVQCLEISESASDSRPKRPKAPMHKRSFSTGSLEVEILDETSTTEGRITKSKSGKSVVGAKSPKQKSKGSKWARVKKVLTGQFWYEDLGTTLKSLKELGRSAQRYSTVSSEGQDFSSAAQQRSLDSSLDPDLLGSRLPRASFASAEASSAGRSPNIPGSGESGGVEELGTEIWMGPPGWWEQYEASKRQSEASNSSDVGSVIEVKTMYLGSKQKDTERLLKVKTLTRRQSSPSLSTKGAEGEEEEGEEEAHPVHRSASYKDEELELSKDLSSSGPSSKPDSKKLHRKAWGRVKDIIHVRKDSVKKRSRRIEREKESSEWSQGEEISEVDIEGLMEEQLSGEFGEGIISRSTPKTSPMVIPRQSSTSKSFSESPPQGTDPSLLTTTKMASAAGGSEMAALLASSLSEEFAQKLQTWQELQLRKSSSFKASGGGGGGGGGGSGEAEGSVSVVDGAGIVEIQEPTVSYSGTTTQGETVTERPRSKGASPSQSSVEGQPQPEGAPVPSEPSPTELQPPSVNVEELHRRISESFSRKLAEWERRKYRRPTTPEMEHKGARSRKEKEKEKEERSRSKKSREEKERERLEKAREREIQKVEKEQVKLEKEKVRIEKERLRAMERQAKLERMKGRLSQADSEAASTQPPVSSGSPPPGAGPAPAPAPTTTAAQDMPQYKVNVTADFKKKLEEWEQMKSSLTLPADPFSTASPPEGTTPSPQPTTSPPTFPLEPTASAERPPSSDAKPPPLTLQPYYLLDTPEERSPVDKASDVSYGDDSTSVTEESYTRSNITSLERANSELLREVARKEAEYGMLQEEVQKLNSKLDKVRQEHAAEMARFRRELEAGTVAGPVQLEVGELESTVRELEEKIALMENAGDQLAESMETAAIGKWQSVEGEEVVSQQLVDMVEQMKDMLVQASHTRESPPPHPSSTLPPLPPSPPLPSPPPPSLPALLASGELMQKTMALHNFEKVYSHAMKLQVQMNNLRVSQLERNKEIMLIKRQLLLQEVNNVLLQAHITRRETELYQYREARRQGVAVRRWNTFSGQGDSEARPPLLRNVSLHDNDDPFHPATFSSSPPPPPSAISSSSTSAKPSAKHDDIPCITDEDASIPAARIAEGTKAERGIPPPSSAFPLITTTAPTPEKSTDHQESHLASRVAATTTPTPSPSPSHAVAPASQPPPPSAKSTRTVEQGETRVTSPGVASADTAEVSAAPSAQQATPPPLPSSSSPTSSKEKATTRTPSSAATSETTTTTMTTATSKASKVETGSPTLLTQTSVGSPSASSPAVEGLKKTSSPETETPAQPIPERPDTGVESSSPPAQSTSPDDDAYSQTESVMECTKPVLDPAASSLQGEPSSTGPLPSRVHEGAAGGVDISSQGQPPRAVRSPVSRHKYLRRQKEEREKRRDIPSSPKSSHSGESGKPPLPRQSTPHQSPSATHRSKSVGDMDGIQPDSAQAAAPLRDVIQKFEKRATVCETEERKIEFRKTPSPTLHLPRVGLVSRVRRLKPAAELLQESQRYRSGHSIYATRIMQRYLPGKSPQAGAAAAIPSPVPSQDKENISGTSYVQAIVRKLSRESTPVRSPGSSSASSSLSLHRTDSPGRVHSDLVSSLVQKLSSSSGPTDATHKTSSSLPLKDLTNEGQGKPLSQAFAAEEAHGPTITAHQTVPASDLAASDRTRAAEGVSLPPASVTEGPASQYQAKPDSTISPSSHLSMPALASTDQPEIAEESARERAATYCVSEGDRPRQQPQQHQQQQIRGPDDNSESIEQIAEEFLDPALLSIREKKGQKISPSSSTNSKNALCCQSSTCTKSKSSSSSSSPQTARVQKVPSSPKSPERRSGREKMETIGVLCKQSMSFDLGVSLRAQSPEAMPQRPQSAESLRTAPELEAGEREGAKARPSSTSSEGEVAASSEEKKKSRARFLDSSWLQKPKKFFKVSK